jgi:hypothetical protein
MPYHCVPCYRRIYPEEHSRQYYDLREYDFRLYLDLQK